MKERKTKNISLRDMSIITEALVKNNYSIADTFEELKDNYTYMHIVKAARLGGYNLVGTTTFVKSKKVTTYEIQMDVNEQCEEN